MAAQNISSTTSTDRSREAPARDAWRRERDGGRPHTPTGPALEAGWNMTATEHLCPACATASVTEEGTEQDRPALPPIVAPSMRPDICWPVSSVAAARAWDEPR